jgi:hypothetical protein
LTIGCPALSLRIVEQRPLMVELLGCRAALGTDLRKARRHHKTLGTCRLARPRSCIDFNPLTLDAPAVRGLVVRGMHREHCHQQARQHKPR